VTANESTDVGDSDAGAALATAAAAAAAATAAADPDVEIPSRECPLTLCAYLRPSEPYRTRRIINSIPNAGDTISRRTFPRAEERDMGALPAASNTALRSASSGSDP